MKIDKVIFSIDDNPHYKGFWSSISNHFNNRLGIKPKLFIIGNQVDTSGYDTTNGEIEVVPKIEGIPSIIQALWAKFYYVKTEPETTWLVGDLDLYPLQRYHFIDKIKDVSEEAYVHLNPYGYGKDWRNGYNGLPGYFHCAKGKTFIDELKLERSFEEIVKEIYISNTWGIKFYNIQENNENRMASPDHGWFCCEEMYTGYLLKESKKLVEIDPEGGYLRIDRSHMVYNTNDISRGVYIDFHSPRPYEMHSEEIEKIVSLFPNG
jgi:hypothetical protein